ncbi:MAG TPA: hypothetical protein VHV56_02070 [Pseudolabrys sp.]|jgi:hypothetical protein|nr:hypothetical protein [Pseudolabrys sp.]
MKALFVALVVAAAALGGPSSLAADQRNVTVVNGTGYGIKFLGFNNPGDNDWSENELGRVFADGEDIYVKFNTADHGCVWNFRISWEEPGYPDVLWRNVNLCQLEKLTLKYERSTDTTSFVGE